MIVKCPECRKKRDLSDLKEATRIDEESGEEIYSTVVCPCGFWFGDYDEVEDEYIVVLEEDY